MNRQALPLRVRGKDEVNDTPLYANIQGICQRKSESEADGGDEKAISMMLGTRYLVSIARLAFFSLRLVN